MVGASRKSFIARASGGEAVDNRLGGSLAAALFAANRGVDLVRVHDVAETRQALAVLAGDREGAFLRLDSGRRSRRDAGAGSARPE